MFYLNDSQCLKQIGLALADVDYPDLMFKKTKYLKKFQTKFSNNVLIGKNVKIGKKFYDRF